MVIRIDTGRNGPFFHLRDLQNSENYLRKSFDSLKFGDRMRNMKILIEIEDEDGELLDALAKEQDRSRSGQARHMLLRAIKEATADPGDTEA